MYALQPEQWVHLYAGSAGTGAAATLTNFQTVWLAQRRLAENLGRISITGRSDDLPGQRGAGARITGTKSRPRRAGQSLPVWAWRERLWPPGRQASARNLSTQCMCSIAPSYELTATEERATLLKPTIDRISGVYPPNASATSSFCSRSWRVFAPTAGLALALRPA